MQIFPLALDSKEGWGTVADGGYRLPSIRFVDLALMVGTESWRIESITGGCFSDPPVKNRILGRIKMNFFLNSQIISTLF